MNVTFCGKRDFTGVIKLRILRWDAYSGQSGWALNVIVSVLFKREVEEEGLTTVEEKAM